MNYANGNREFNGTLGPRVSCYATAKLAAVKMATQGQGRPVLTGREWFRRRRKRERLTELVGPLGFEPRTKGLCIPLRLSPPDENPCVVWTMPSPCRCRFRWVIMASTPSCIGYPVHAWLGVGSPLRVGRSPNLHLTTGKFLYQRPNLSPLL